MVRSFVLNFVVYYLLLFFVCCTFVICLWFGARCSLCVVVCCLFLVVCCLWLSVFVDY